MKILILTKLSCIQNSLIWSHFCHHHDSPHRDRNIPKPSVYYIIIPCKTARLQSLGKQKHNLVSVLLTFWMVMNNSITFSKHQDSCSNALNSPVCCSVDYMANKWHVHTPTIKISAWSQKSTRMLLAEPDQNQAILRSLLSGG